MNKRIKLKKGILHKKCDNKCSMYRVIEREKFTTNNGCIGCKHKAIAEKMCEENEKFWVFMTCEDKRKYEKDKQLKDIEALLNKEFAERVDEEFNNAKNVYGYHEYMRVLRAIKRILLNGTTDEELIIKHMKTQITMKFNM